MTHHRTAIREALAAAVTGLPTTGANVYEGRGKPIDPRKLPALRVRFLREAAERSAMGAGGGAPLFRTADFAVTAYADGIAFEDLLDGISAEVETALGADPKVGGRALDCVLQGTEFEEYGAGDKPAGALTLIYRVRYRTAIGAPGGAV